MKKIVIKYHDDDLGNIGKIKIGDWVDSRAEEDICISQGFCNLIPLDVSMKLPKGYEVSVIPLNSDFRGYGIARRGIAGQLATKWYLMTFAAEDIKILKGEKVCQVGIVKSKPCIGFIKKRLMSNKR